MSARLINIVVNQVVREVDEVFHVAMDISEVTTAQARDVRVVELAPVVNTMIEH